MRTLRHAVERGNVHHAYLFVGSRGTGKTSMAKILASCLNCERGPTVDPCGQCDSCRSIASATSLDVIEMDAASNNSVDDIRELRESVVFAPVSGRHKVYILDEAHMLSQAAWNAFLKTLEEPPPHTVFVLATTEAAKVPATVVDRCHRFDFHRPTVEQIASVLSRAAVSESIEIPPEALAAIARSATGSFRDALGTLEQLVTYSGSKIELPDVLAVLGVADEQLLSDAFDAVQSGDGRAALHAVARCAEGGRDAGSFTRDLEARARELLVVQTLGEVPAELSLTPEIDERLQDQAQRVGRAEVVRVLDLLGAALEATRAGADPRTQLELALVKAATPQVDGSARALLARIERLEQALSGASAGQASAAPVRRTRVVGCVRDARCAHTAGGVGGLCRGWSRRWRLGACAAGYLRVGCVRGACKVHPRRRSRPRSPRRKRQVRLCLWGSRRRSRLLPQYPSRPLSQSRPLRPPRHLPRHRLSRRAMGGSRGGRQRLSRPRQAISTRYGPPRTSRFVPSTACSGLSSARRRP